MEIITENEGESANASKPESLGVPERPPLRPSPPRAPQKQQQGDAIFRRMKEGAIWRSTPDALTTNKRGLPAYHYALGASSILNFDLGAPHSGHLYESPKNFPSLPAAINKV